MPSPMQPRALPLMIKQYLNTLTRVEARRVLDAGSRMVPAQDTTGRSLRCLIATAAPGYHNTIRTMADGSPLSPSRVGSAYDGLCDQHGTLVVNAHIRHWLSARDARTQLRAAERIRTREHARALAINAARDRICDALIAAFQPVPTVASNAVALV